MNDKHYFQIEKEQILNRISDVIRERNLTNADICRRTNYSASKVCKILSRNQELNLEFVLSFATEFCNGDYIYFFTGIPKSALTSLNELVKLIKDVPLEQKGNLLDNILVIANMFKKF